MLSLDLAWLAVECLSTLCLCCRDVGSVCTPGSCRNKGRVYRVFVCFALVRTVKAFRVWCSCRCGRRQACCWRNTRQPVDKDFSCACVLLGHRTSRPVATCGACRPDASPVWCTYVGLASLHVPQPTPCCQRLVNHSSFGVSRDQ